MSGASTRSFTLPRRENRRKELGCRFVDHHRPQDRVSHSCQSLKPESLGLIRRAVRPFPAPMPMVRRHPLRRPGLLLVGVLLHSTLDDALLDYGGAESIQQGDRRVKADGSLSTGRDPAWPARRRPALRREPSFSRTSPGHTFRPSPAARQRRGDGSRLGRDLGDELPHHRGPHGPQMAVFASSKSSMKFAALPAVPQAPGFGGTN